MGGKYRIGKNVVSQSEFDAEALRLYRGGIEIGEFDPATKSGTGICGRLRRERTSIWRALKRANIGVGDVEQAQFKADRQYHQMTSDEFGKEPVIKAWIDGMLVRRVGSYKRQVSRVKRVCDELGIYPDQFDLTYAKKWLATKSHISLKDLRPSKVCVRNYLKSQGVNDYELTLAGFDAKHYGVGEFKHIKMTSEQIAKCQSLLAGEMPEALFVFNFGIETCRPLEPIWNLRGDSFYTLQNGSKTLYCVNVFRKKTEKSGAAFKTAYVSQSTYLQASALSQKNGGQIMDGIKPKTIYAILRKVYREVGLTNEYFAKHPVHALRHCGAQRLLEKTGFNRAVVAELGGWEAEKTLEDHYGGVPEDIIRGIAGEVL